MNLPKLKPLPTIDIDLGSLREGRAELVGDDALILAGHVVLHIVQVEL